MKKLLLALALIVSATTANADALEDCVINAKIVKEAKIAQQKGYTREQVKNALEKLGIYNAGSWVDIAFESNVNFDADKYSNFIYGVCVAKSGALK